MDKRKAHRQDESGIELTDMGGKISREIDLAIERKKMNGLVVSRENEHEIQI